MATLEERVKRLEDKVFGVPTEESFRLKQSLSILDKNVLAFPNSVVFWNSNTQDYNLYLRIQRNSGSNVYDSYTGSKMDNIVIVPQSINLPAYSTIVSSKKGLFATKHTWKGNPSFPYGQFYRFDSFEWRWKLLREDTSPSGEDRGVFWCEDWNRFIMYCRRHPYTDRRLKLYESPDFVNWEAPFQSDFEPCVLDTNQRFYSANGFILGDRLFVVTNVISYDDWTVTPHLHVAIAEGNYTATLPSSFNTFHLPSEFPEIDGDNVKQLFVYPQVVNGKVVFTCIKCGEPHEHGNISTGIHWTEVWDMPIDKFLEKYE